MIYLLYLYMSYDILLDLTWRSLRSQVRCFGSVCSWRDLRPGIARSWKRGSAEPRTKTHLISLMRHRDHIKIRYI